MITSEQRSGFDRRHHPTAGRRHNNRNEIPANNPVNKNHFIANVSHEIRTPMHAILAMIDLLGETALTQQQARYLRVFKDAGEHLLSLLNELLDYSRLESGEIQLNNLPFHLPQLVTGVLDLMQTQARDKKINFYCSIDPALAPWRSGDPQRLRQILVNLVSNAIKFTRAGEINIKVTAINKDRVLLEVMDTGAGIPEAQQKIIFDSFVQADNGHDQHLWGVGLGLSICKQLAKAMKGEIHVRSQIDVGSTFVCDLVLPAVCEPWIETDLSNVHVLCHEGHLSALSVLVVDDSLLNCRVMEDLLCQSGCLPVCVSNGQEAINCLSNKHYDLVLMDLRMPVMDGLTAMRLIRHHEKEQRKSRMPIIALTAGLLSNERDTAREAGCDAFLAKPVSKDQLMQLLENILQTV